MKINLSETTLHKALLVSTIIALFLAGYVAYSYNEIELLLEEEIQQNSNLMADLDVARSEINTLTEISAEQKQIIDSFSGQISSISSTVGDLEKLAQTDEELLKKYSKVYFLNENYVPSKLTDINEDYVYNGTTNYLIHADVWPFLKNLMDQARREGVELQAASAFRSFDTQASLKAGYSVTYGTGANQFVADQGYSEHQLGTSIDFTTPKVGAVFSKFSTDPAYKWLVDNAYRYGFILSYPEGNKYYKFEPWHWRFVGVELATYLYKQDKNFYDLDQREIDKYLIKLFD